MSNENNEKINKICEEYGTRIFENEPIKKHTTFGIGGNCKYFIDINSVDCLKKILDELKNSNSRYFIMGRGSNILASDNGYDGYIIHFGNSFSGIKKNDDGTIDALSGTPMNLLGKYAIENSLSGFECLCGIPGTLGGAIYMNAGAYGEEISDVVVSVTSIDNNGNEKIYKKEDMDFSYRHSIFNENSEIITSVNLQLKPANKKEIEEYTSELLERRREKQPLEFKSAGSTFKRPKGDYASRLIEQCGLKGMSVGDAEVSTKHSGFIINKGNASCSDVIELCQKVQKIVMEKTGYKLEIEPVILK